jgi:glycosyltransferase involved in cell wall biosynthesis
MRILSLGPHEGFVELWLRRQLPDAEIDAVELHSGDVEACRKRGINCVQGHAEDAYRYFEQGSYDAVVLFELIEHVPDMDRLLSVAEQMIHPGGLVLVSTPDGTFGTGNNPHHLRVLRSIDLAELLRARGTLHRMAVGSDRLTLAAYRPAPKRGTVAIYTGPSWMTWSPADIEAKGLGGSETAAARLADALSELGWIVTVYGQVEQGCHDQVIYRHHDTFDPLVRRDVVICSRIPEIFDRPVNARRRLLWVHDVDCGPRLTPERARRIDRVLTLSAWQTGHLLDVYPWLGETRKVREIRNGLDLAPYALNGKVPKRRKRVVYTSSPDRGLDLLLELWPEVRKRVKGATLEYAYAPVYFEIAGKDPLVAQHAERIAQLSRQPGVKALGSLSQPAIAKLLRESLVWAHPSWCTPHDVPFHETSCIGAVEAQAAGCCVVASSWGALPETVRVGALIDADVKGEYWRDCFIEAIVRGLTNQLVQSDAQQEGPKAVAGLGWGPVAERITEIVG